MTVRHRAPCDEFVGGPFLIDGHVHYYPNFDRDRFFDSAFANFRSVPGVRGTASKYAGWLLFAESAGMHYFRRFRNAAGEAGGGWTFHGTNEAESLVAQRDADARLLLIAGRQIITSEGLEVLALGCDAEVDDGQPLPGRRRRCEQPGRDCGTSVGLREMVVSAGRRD